MITYAYYPGCVAQESGKELDNATKFIAGKLGMNLIPMLFCAFFEFDNFF